MLYGSVRVMIFLDVLRQRLGASEPRAGGATEVEAHQFLDEAGFRMDNDGPWSTDVIALNVLYPDEYVRLDTPRLDASGM